jgi:hypothetical protein
MRGIAAALVFSCAIGMVTSVCAQDGAGETMYRYRGTGGRVVYTNNAEQVPENQRPKAKVDLSRRSLNTEIGTELQERLAAQHDALIKTPYCREALAAANRDLLTQAWNDFRPLCVAAGAILFLFLVSPAALRRFGAPQWAKTLTMAIPILGVGGLLLFVFDGSSHALHSLKQQAAPCMHETFTRLSGQPNAQALQTQLIGTLQQHIAGLEKLGREGKEQLTRAVQ